MKKIEPSWGVIIVLVIINTVIFVKHYPEKIEIAINNVKIQVLHLEACYFHCKTFAELDNISRMLKKMQRDIDKADRRGENTLERKKAFNLLFLSFQEEIKKTGEPNYAVFLSNLKPYKI